MNRSEKKDENECYTTPFGGRMPAAGVATAAGSGDGEERKKKERKKKKKKELGLIWDFRIVVRPDLGFSNSC